MLECIKVRMYGDYKCACGCGRILGGVAPAHGVGDSDDEEGRFWRMFHVDCWESGIKYLPKEEIYTTFAPSKEVE